MASSVMVSSATAMSRATPAHSRWSQTQVQPAAFLATRKSYTDLSKLPSNGGRVQCMQVWPMEGKKEFKTLSYLPDLTVEQLLKQMEYLIHSKWIPCLEFSKVIDNVPVG